MSVTHTFLVQPGIWKAEGQFVDAVGNVYPVTGSAEITHDAGLWYNRAAMQVMADEPMDIECVYEIIPLAAGADCTTWVAETLPLGRIQGSFVLVDNTILSVANTDQAQNMESLRMIDVNTYENRGALLVEGKKMSSWIVTMRRQNE